MSTEQAESTDEDDGGSPRFRKKTRVQIALAKFHGLGEDGESWTVERIADYLNVTPSTIQDYIHNTELSERVEEQLAESQARVRMRLAMKYLDRLDEIEELIQERREIKEVEVTSHRNINVEGKVVMQRDGMSVGGENTEHVDFTVPVPDHFKEITDVSNELETLMKEWRMTAQQVENLLGLEAPDQIESEHREVSIEGRVFEGIDMGGFPDADAELEGTEIDLDDQ